MFYKHILFISAACHHDDVMAAHNAPKHDFAPAWLKIPSQENPVRFTFIGIILKLKRRFHLLYQCSYFSYINDVKLYKYIIHVFSNIVVYYTKYYLGTWQMHSFSRKCE